MHRKKIFFGKARAFCVDGRRPNSPSTDFYNECAGFRLPAGSQNVFPKKGPKMSATHFMVFLRLGLRATKKTCFLKRKSAFMFTVVLFSRNFAQRYLRGLHGVGHVTFTCDNRLMRFDQPTKHQMGKILRKYIADLMLCRM